MAPSRKAQGKRIQNATRKKRRKRQREAKRQRKALYQSRSAGKRLLDEKNKEEEEEDSIVPSESSTTHPLGKRKFTKNKKGTPMKVVWSSVAEERDKKEIVRMEKLLKINLKGNTNKLPNSFKEDGLDCIFFTVRIIKKGSSHIKMGVMFCCWWVCSLGIW